MRLCTGSVVCNVLSPCSNLQGPWLLRRTSFHPRPGSRHGEPFRGSRPNPTAARAFNRQNSPPRPAPLSRQKHPHLPEAALKLRQPKKQRIHTGRVFPEFHLLCHCSVDQAAMRCWRAGRRRPRMRGGADRRFPRKVARQRPDVGAPVVRLEPDKGAPVPPSLSAPRRGSLPLTGPGRKCFLTWPRQGAALGGGEPRNWGRSPSRALELRE